MNSHSGLHPASAATGPGSNPSRYNADYPLASPGYNDPSQSYPQHQHQQQQQQQQQQQYLSPGHSPQPYHDDSRPSMRRASRSAPAPPYPVTDADALLQPPNSHLGGGGGGGVPSAAATAGGRPRAWSGNSQRSHHSTHSNHSHRSNRSTRSARSHDEHYRRHEAHYSDGSGHHHHHHHHESSSAGGHHHHSHQHGSSYGDEDGRRPEHRKRHHSDAALQRRDTHRPTLGDTVFSVWDTVKSALGPRDKY